MLNKEVAFLRCQIRVVVVNAYDWVTFLAVIVPNTNQLSLSLLPLYQLT